MPEKLSQSWNTAGRRHLEGGMLGGCHLEKLLHDDGVCEVFRATNGLEEPCLVKCFGEKVAPYDDVAVKQALAHERRLAAHPELRNVQSVSETEPLVDSHVVCVWHKGRSLADLLHEDGVFDDVRCLSVARDVVAELKAYETAGVGHGSLTLAGVMQDDDGRIFLGSSGFPGMTGRFASLEARRGQLDGRADFYSVGVMMYELLCGESPFGAAGEVTFLWERRPDISADLCLLVHRLFSAKRDIRPKNVQDLLACLNGVDLSRHLSSDALSAKLRELEEAEPSKPVRTMKALSADVRNRTMKTNNSWLLKLVGAVLVLLSFGVGYGWANSGQGSLRIPKSLSFLEPALKKIVPVRDEDVKGGDVAAAPTETAADGGTEAIENAEDDAEEDDAEVAVKQEVAQKDPNEPQDDSQTEKTAAKQQEDEEASEEETMERWTDNDHENANNATEKMERWTDNDKKNDNAAMKTEEKKPEEKLNVEDAAELQKQLEAALKKRNVKEIKELMNAGAKLDWVSEDGTSLLQQACARGHWDAVEFMLKQGANPNWRPKVPGEKFKLPLQITLDNGKKTYSAMLMLLKYKADPQLLFDTALYFTNTDGGGKQPIRKDSVGIVALCQYGYLNENRTAQLELLSAWMEANKGELSDELSAALLSNAIDQKMSKAFLKAILQRIKSMKSPKYGSVLLAAMKHKNRIELLGTLKERGIQVNNVCELEKDGVLVEETPLYYAVRTKCDEQVVRWLLANGASVKWTDAGGKTVMDLEADPKIKQLLLNAKQGKKVTQEWSGDLYTTGTTTIKTNMPWEADLNGVTVKSDHENWITTQPPKNDKKMEGDIDFFWQYDKDEKTLTLEPRNGCEVLVMTGNLTPFDQIEVRYIAKQKFSDTTLSYSKEEGSPLKAGSIILFRTSRGNFGKFRVIRYEDEVIDGKKRRNVSLMIHWVVYHLEEEEVRQSHSKRTIW